MGPDGSGQHAGDGNQASVERKLAQRRQARQRILGDDLHGDQQPQCYGQVEMAAFLGQVGGREIDGDALGREGEPHGADCGTHPLAAFGHRLVGQADDGKGGQAGGDLDLHVDRHHVDALEGEAVDPGDHGRKFRARRPAWLTPVWGYPVVMYNRRQAVALRSWPRGCPQSTMKSLAPPSVTERWARVSSATW